MKKFSFGLLALVCALSVSAASQAGTVRFGGDIGLLPAGTTSGVLQVIMDLDAADNFDDGGITLGISSATAGIIRFDSIAVTGQWELQQSSVANADRANISVNSVSPASVGGVPTGAQNYVLATIPYTVLSQAPATTGLSFIVEPDFSLVDGRDFGTNVTPNYTFQGDALIQVGVPEPATLAMAGMSLIGLAFRRRNG